MFRSLLLAVISVSLVSRVSAPDTVQRPDSTTVGHWQGRKFGMFIHFGLYSTLGGTWQGKQYNGNYSEQIQSDAHIPSAEYAALAKSFQPTHWDPDAIVRLAQQAGMQFIVLTAKHHDGFNLFGTHETRFNVVEATPYGRDIVKSLADACARVHMPFGVYYSTIDWHYGDVPDQSNDNRISPEHEAFNARQLQELMTGYGPLTEIWFDMGHPTKPQSEHFANIVHTFQPQCLVSGRVWNNQGDFLEMGDDEIPDYTLDQPWEAPASIFAETWGYRSWQKRTDIDAKRREHILRLVRVVSHGGNYILNIGPEGDGSVVPYETQVLQGIGAWLKSNGVAIYNTSPQPFRTLPFGFATVKGNRLFLFVEHLPAGGNLLLPGLQNSISKAYPLTATDRSLEVRKTTAGVTIHAAQLTGFLPVIAIEFQGALEVHQSSPAQAQTDGSIALRAEQADHFFNTNGEGYYDSPTLRKQQWVFSVARSGRYEIQIETKPGQCSRVVDVTVGGERFTPVLHIRSDGSHLHRIGEAQLAAGKDIILTLEPGKPAEPGAVLDIPVEQVILKPLS